MATRSIVPFGPQHPVLPEPVHLDLVLEDETVVEAVPSIGFVHRGLEKLVEKKDFKELHVMVSSGNIGMPCFVCRQVISEFFSKDSFVYCYSTHGDVEKYTVEELCPYPFGEDDLV